MTNYELICGDCLEVMPTLADGSADMILADLPYGTTACAWDTVIPFEPLWAQYKRLIKPRGAVVLFGSQPFTSALVMSNAAWFKYAWVWDKNRGNGHLIAKFRPLQQSEDIAVFGNKTIQYNPQMVKRKKNRKFGKSPSESEILSRQNFRLDYTREDYTHRYPTNILCFSWATRDGLHPTQKPVALLKYLIRTYTSEGETVLDNTMGSGSTGVAAMLTGRRFIGIELDETYFAIAQRRIEDAARQARGEFRTITDNQTHEDLPLFAGA